MSKLIYVADDEKNIRELISTFLVNEGYKIKTFEDGDTLLGEFLQNPCDLAILDIMMDGTDGFAICSQIRAKSGIPIIIVSAKDSELDKITGITLGSDDYLIKPFSPIELVARVKAIFRRISLDKSENQTGIIRFGDILLNPAVRESFLHNEKLDLTPTEFSLLAYLFSHSERAVSRDELLKNVWKFDIAVDTRAVDDVLKRLRRKIAQSSVIIEAVWGFGFKLSLRGHV